MSKELKPCPFCGGEAKRRDGSSTTPYIRCTRCGCRTGSSRSDERLVAAWNRRVMPVYAKVKLPKETEERIERMVRDEARDALKEIGIIRCKDCKYSHMTIDGKNNKWCSVMATHDIEGIHRDYYPQEAPNGYDPEPYFDADFFCANAEPREDT